jgi:hypothetical protein
MSLRDQALGALTQAAKSKLGPEGRQAIDVFKRLKDKVSVKFPGTNRGPGGALNAIMSRPDPLMTFNWRSYLL